MASPRPALQGAGLGVVAVDELGLHFVGPVDVPDVGGGLGPELLAEERHQLGMLADGGQLPLLDEPLQAGKIVEPLLQEGHRPFQVVVPGVAEEDVVEGQVLLVIAVEVVPPDGRLHLSVQAIHLPHLRLAETAEGREQGGAFQGPDDFVDVADVLQRQDVDHDLAAGQDGDEALHLQLQQRVAQRRLADAQPLGTSLPCRWPSPGAVRPSASARAGARRPALSAT